MGSTILKEKKIISFNLDSEVLLSKVLKKDREVILQNLKEMRYSQGASTITQQLSKLIFLNTEKTLSRKLRELMIELFCKVLFLFINPYSFFPLNVKFDNFFCHWCKMRTRQLRMFCKNYQGNFRFLVRSKCNKPAMVSFTS